MFLLDDLLLAPGKGAYVLFQELARKAQEEWLNDDTIKQELQQLNEMLEGGSISDKEFEAKECRLLERLEQIARIKFQDKWGAEPAVVGPGVEPEALPAAEPVPQPPADPPPPPPPMPPTVALPVPVPEPMWRSPPAPVAVLTPAVLPPAVLPPAAMPPTWTPPPAPPPITAAAPPPMWTAPRAPLPVQSLAPPATSPPMPPPGTVLTMGQIIECAVRALSIMRMRLSSITSVVPEDSGWRVAIELVERRGVPDTSDVLGLYEVRLDALGNVLRYERTQMRRRGDFGR